MARLGPKARNPHPEAVSPRKAAEILDVHISTIRRWIRRGHLLAYRVGPQIVRIPRSEIAKFRAHRIAYPDRPRNTISIP